MAFVTGSLALWAPTFLFRAAVFTGHRAPCLAGNCAASERYRGWTAEVGRLVWLLAEPLSPPTVCCLAPSPV